MEWWVALIVIFGGLIILMLSGLPIAFSFLLLNLVIAWFALGQGGLLQLTHSIVSSVVTYMLLPLSLFVLMGEVFLHSGIAPRLTDAIDKLIGRLPGRLSLLAVFSGAVFGALTGSTLASVAVLGRGLVPQMVERGYDKQIAIGPILGAGGLAGMIPPSILAIIVGGIGLISIGGILVGILMPAVVMVIVFSAYIIGRCALQPHIAPPYAIRAVPMSEKILGILKYILPVGLIIFLVVGVVFLGIASPSEASATGAMGMFILAALYRKLDWNMVKKTLTGSVSITVMVLMIICGARAFSNNLSYTGATRGLVEFALSLNMAPLLLLIGMQVIVLFMGMFMELASITMIALPLYMPIIAKLGFDPVWFGVVFLLNLTIGAISPPFGMELFVMKGVAPTDTRMGDIYRAVIPFCILDLIVLSLLIAFPQIVLWLPNLIRGT